MVPYYGRATDVDDMWDYMALVVSWPWLLQMLNNNKALTFRVSVLEEDFKEYRHELY